MLFNGYDYYFCCKIHSLSLSTTRPSDKSEESASGDGKYNEILLSVLVFMELSKQLFPQLLIYTIACWGYFFLMRLNVMYFYFSHFGGEWNDTIYFKRYLLRFIGES